MKITKIVKEDVDYIIDSCGGERLAHRLENKTVYIAGASGMLGAYFCYTLIQLSERYDIKTNLIASVHNAEHLDPYIANSEIEATIVEDITEFAPIEFEGKVDYIIHAASPASPKIMKNQPVMTNLANSLGAAPPTKSGQK